MDTVLDYFDSLVEGIAYAAAKQKLRGAAERTLRRGLHVVLWVVGIVAIVVAILSIAVVSYLLLYWLLVPAVHLEKPVFFNYDTPSHRPEARINLVNRQWSSTNVTARLYPSQTNLLVSGVRYDIELEVKVPDSPRNRDISMVMAKLKVESCDGTLLAQSQRPILLEYKGTLARLVYEFAYMVPLAFGWVREEQHQTIKLIDGFQEDSTFYACTAVVELSKPEFEVYSSSMQFSAQLTGIRYAMYYWLFTSGVFGITTILATESLFVAAAIGYLVYLRVKKRMREREEEEASRSGARRPEGEHEGVAKLGESQKRTTIDSRQAVHRGDSSESSGDDLTPASAPPQEHKVADEVTPRDGATASSGPRILLSGPMRTQQADVDSSDENTEHDHSSGASAAATSTSGTSAGHASSDEDDDDSPPRAELRRRAVGLGLNDDVAQ